MLLSVILFVPFCQLQFFSLVSTVPTFTFKTVTFKMCLNFADLPFTAWYECHRRNSHYVITHECNGNCTHLKEIA